MLGIFSGSVIDFLRISRLMKNYGIFIKKSVYTKVRRLISIVIGWWTSYNIN